MKATLNGEKVELAREVPNKEIKAISTKLNKTHGTKLKIVAISTIAMIEAFILKIEELDTSKAKINKEFSDFYNGLFPKADKKKPAAKKEPAKKKSAAKKEPAKKKESKGPGVIASILEFIKSGPITKEKILTKLEKRFPDRDTVGMEKTIKAQISGKKRPLRMEKQKKVKFVISDKEAYTIK